SQQHVEAYFNIGKSVAGALTSTPARLRELLGDCTSASGAAATTCIDQFVARFGKRVLRHPLSDVEKTFYREVYKDSTSVDAADVADVITVLLTSPGFVYQVEIGSEPVPSASGLYELSDHE